MADMVFVVCASLVFWTDFVKTVHRGTFAVPDLNGQEVEEEYMHAHDIGRKGGGEKEGVTEGRGGGDKREGEEGEEGRGRREEGRGVERTVKGRKERVRKEEEDEQGEKKKGRGKVRGARRKKKR